MIGIFDSGVGGLSVFREIRKLLPEESYIYYSDNAHCPYGEKTREYITDRARYITRLLLSKGADIIVVACNTATAAAISTLRAEFPDTRFIGMEPAIKPAALSTRTGVIGVLATAGTLKADKYLLNRGRWAENVRIVEHVGKGFVELVESGDTASEAAGKAVRESLKPLLDEGADKIVLGCTHYPFLSGTIRKVAQELYPERDVEIIDPAPAVARHLVEVMEAEGLIKTEDKAYSITLLSSGDDSCLKETYKKLL
ncbi:MAG: glutamate racemase [Bacteroidales bacterium]|nr:glutamate racemase [Bacteroidales bacterium]